MRSSRVHQGLAAVLVGGLATAGARAQVDPAQLPPVLTTQPTTQSTIQPATMSQAQVAQAVSALNSPDAAEQAAARVKLMGLSRDQLPLLRQCVERLQRVSPSTAASLHEIVLQDYLAEEPYPVDPARGFLGLRWADVGLDTSARLGVPVGVRLLGFPGYRLLQTGDLILGLVVQPDLPLQQPPNRVTPDRTDLQNDIRDAGAAHQIVLEVLRQGERIRLPVTLYPGLAIDQTEVDAFTDQRRAKGEAYWRDNFLPVIRPGVS